MNFFVKSFAMEIILTAVDKTFIRGTQVLSNLVSGADIKLS